MRKRLLFAFMAMATASSVNAEQFLISCLFQSSVIKTTNPIAAEWAEPGSFRKMEWIFKTEPFEILEGPGALRKASVVDGISRPAESDWFWGTPLTTVTDREIRLLFSPRAKPLERSIQFDIKIDRFSGEASRVFTMLEPGKGRFAYWTQLADCAIHKRQI